MRYMKFNNGGGLASMLSQISSQKGEKGDKKSFTMVGQYADSVERDGDREYVMYEMPDGNKVKVYGNWNEYAVSRDDQGRDMIGDEDYPVVMNEQGEYQLDEAALEAANGGSTPQRVSSAAQGGPGASPMEDLLEQLNQVKSPGQQGPFKDGGKILKYNMGGGVPGGTAPTRPFETGAYDAANALTFQQRPNAKGMSPDVLFFLDGRPVTPKEAVDYYVSEIGPREEFNYWMRKQSAATKPTPQNVERIAAQMSSPGYVPGQTYSSNTANAQRQTAGTLRNIYGGTQTFGPDTSRARVAEDILRGLANWNQ